LKYWNLVKSISDLAGIGPRLAMPHISNAIWKYFDADFDREFSADDCTLIAIHVMIRTDLEFASRMIEPIEKCLTANR
jgi:hypothetical protein